MGHPLRVCCTQTLARPHTNLAAGTANVSGSHSSHRALELGSPCPVLQRWFSRVNPLSRSSLEILSQAAFAFLSPVALMCSQASCASNGNEIITSCTVGFFPSAPLLDYGKHVYADLVAEVERCRKIAKGFPHFGREVNGHNSGVQIAHFAQMARHRISLVLFRHHADRQWLHLPKAKFKPDF